MSVSERIDAVLAAGGTVMVCREPGADVLVMVRPGHAVVTERFDAVGGVLWGLADPEHRRDACATACATRLCS